MRGSDLKFIQWLLRKNGVFEISKAIQEGSWVKIVSGPLQKYGGKIIRLNKKRHCAEIEIETFGTINKVWLSYELIEIKKPLSQSN
jgi:transcription antitermination factor NusG